MTLFWSTSYKKTETSNSTFNFLHLKPAVIKQQVFKSGAVESIKTSCRKHWQLCSDVQMFSWQNDAKQKRSEWDGPFLCLNHAPACFGFLSSLKLHCGTTCASLFFSQTLLSWLGMLTTTKYKWIYESWHCPLTQMFFGRWWRTNSNGENNLPGCFQKTTFLETKARFILLVQIKLFAYLTGWSTKHVKVRQFPCNNLAFIYLVY